MSHTQTIAMARGLLAEGRGEDVVRMIAPLLDGAEADDGAEALLLQCLWARVRLLRAGDVPAVTEALGAYADSKTRATLPPAVRAEVALWLGWAYAWQDPATFDDARALGLLDEAERLFREAHDASGRCWAGLGRARTFFAIDEPGLMRGALDDVAALQDRLRDAEADLWAHDLRLLAARYAGAYTEAADHRDALAEAADRLDDPFAAARARAYGATLDFDLGRPPAALATRAAEAADALTRHAVRPGAALLVAHRTRVHALLRAGAWDDADAAAEAAARALADVRHGAASLRLAQARLATLRGAHDRAYAHLEAARVGLATPQHRCLAAAAALATADLLRREGRADEALLWAERAWLGARETDYDAQALRALLDLVDTLRALGRTDEAQARLREAERYGTLLGLLPPAAYRFGVQGRLARAEGRLDDARALFAQALAGYTLIGDVYGQACMQLALAEAGTDATATPPLLDAARATFDRLGCAAEAARTRTPTPRRTAPPDDPADLRLGAALARASLSVDLVAEAWLQAAETSLPGCWKGIYRCGEDHSWTRVHEHGAPPADLAFPDPSAAEAHVGAVRWLRLRAHPGPALFFGAAADPAAWAGAQARLRPWLPVATLAFDHALLRALRLGHTPASAGDAPPLRDFVYASPALRDVAGLVRRIHASHSPVLIHGEPGAGKGVVARAVHAASERRDAPFVVFNAATVPPELAEGALFGYAPGARPRTDAGALAEAEGGTLFVAEVGDLPLPVQRRLVRFLQNGEAYPVGADRPIAPNVRLVAATSRDLEALVRAGQFREDLLHRLAVIPVHVPPLRERREEVPLLLRHFIDRLRAPGVPRPSVTNRAMDVLLHYDWPGNVRQLRNEVERALAIVSSEPAPTIDVGVLSPALMRAAGDGAAGTPPAAPLDRILHPEYDLDTLLAHTERDLIERVLNACDGSVTASADMLGLTRQGLYKKMKRLGIDPARFARPDAAPSQAS